MKRVALEEIEEEVGMKEKKMASKEAEEEIILTKTSKTGDVEKEEV